MHGESGRLVCIPFLFPLCYYVSHYFSKNRFWFFSFSNHWKSDWFLIEFAWWMTDVWNTVQCSGNCMEWNLFIGKNNLNKKQTSTRLSVIIFTILIRVISKSHAKNWDLHKFWLMFCFLRFFVATLGVKLYFLKWLLIRKATSFFCKS